MKEPVVETPKSLFDHVSLIPDPRMKNKCRHKMEDIVMISICAILCGADDWNSIARFGVSKKNWLLEFLELPNGIPSHDTFRRLFSILSPDAFRNFFSDWVRDIAGVVNGVIAIDGKTLRRSHDKRLGIGAIHMVSAWSADNGIVLGQVKTEEKSNEITAIPKLLKILALKGCIITIDAMGCQKAIASQIVDQGGDYLLAVKDNQKNLADAIKSIFAGVEGAEHKDHPIGYHETSERSRDRQETRRHWIIECNDKFACKAEWKGLKTIGMVESQRTIRGKTSVERRYYIGSIEKDAALFGRSVRQHWGIENSLHWRLDMGFREDESRIRKGYSGENFAVMRHMAINLLKKEKTTKLGVKNKRLRAGWDADYLAKLLSDG